MEWRVNRVLCESWWSFQAAFYRCAIVETNCAKNSVCISLIDPPMQVYGFNNSSPASWAMRTALLSSLAQLPLVLVLRRSILRSGPLWQSDVEEGSALVGWNKCRYTFGCTSSVTPSPGNELHVDWCVAGQPPLDGEGRPVLAFQRRLSCLHKIHTCPHKKNSCSHKNNFLIHVSSRYSERRTLCMAGI